MNPLICAVGAALGFSWPVLARFVLAKPFEISVLVAIGTIVFSIVASTIALFSMQERSLAMTRNIFGILFACGIANGIGMAYYNQLLLYKPNYVPIVLILGLPFIIIGMKIFHGDHISRENMCGMMLGCVAIYLMTQK